MGLYVHKLNNNNNFQHEQNNHLTMLKNIVSILKKHLKYFLSTLEKFVLVFYLQKRCRKKNCKSKKKIFLQYFLAYISIIVMIF